MPIDSNMPSGAVAVYEQAETETMRRLVQAGDTVVDVGVMRGARQSLGGCRGVIVEYWPAGIKACGDDPAELWRLFDGWTSATIRRAPQWSNILFEVGK